MANMPSPQDAAARWATNLGGAQQKWEDGVNGVTVAPGQLAARQADKWARNTAAAKPKFAAGAAAVTLQDWQQQTVAKGGPRLATGAQAAQGKVGAVFERLFPYISQQVNSLPARGDLEQNINRMAQFARGMAKFPSTGR